MSKKNVLENFDKIINNIEKQDLETIRELLNYYNGKPVLIDGITYHPYNSPITAARLNERYKTLSGSDHPNFLSQQRKVLDELLQNKEKLIKSGAYTPMYFDTLENLKGNLEQDSSKMEIVNGNEKHVLNRMDSIINDLSHANLDDVDELLNYYNGKPVLIDGITYHPYNSPITAARLNERYKTLSGSDHPNFLSQQRKVLDELLQNKEKLIKAGAYTPMYFDTLENLKGNLEQDSSKMEIVNGNENHVLNRMNSIINDLENANLEDISELLNYYNGKTLLIDGITYHPYNDPMTAMKLNTKYNELSGKDHPNFLKQHEKVLDDLLNNRKALIESGVYSEAYFDRLNTIKEELSNKTNKQCDVENAKKYINRSEIIEVTRNVKLSDMNNILDLITKQKEKSKISKEIND